jgi:LPS export ABC transporter protein LptC
MKIKNRTIFLLIFFLLIFLFLYFKLQKKNELENIKKNTSEEIIYSSNIIENVNYTSKDVDGNEYTITASLGEIDYSNRNILYLTNVVALVKLSNSDNIVIKSDFGKYNTNNFDTIFSKNVTIDYLNNQITGEYLDFSIKRNSMIISRNVVYKNLENLLRADVVEIDLKTKDTRIFMYENDKKVNIKSLD